MAEPELNAWLPSKLNGLGREALKSPSAIRERAFLSESWTISSSPSSRPSPMAWGWDSPFRKPLSKLTAASYGVETILPAGPYSNSPFPQIKTDQFNSMSPPAPSGTVFVVDDDASFLRSVTRLLEAAGYAVKAYESAPQFIEELEPETRGCVLADLMMPELDG